MKYCAFWFAPKGKLEAKAKKALYGKTATRQTQSSVVFLPGGKTWTGTANGQIYVWQGQNLAKVIKEAHRGQVYSMCVNEEFVCTGGRDGKVRLWSHQGEPAGDVLQASAPSQFPRQPGGINSVCFRAATGGAVVAGSRRGEVLALELQQPAAEAVKVLQDSHFEGECWALSIHPVRVQNDFSSPQRARSQAAADQRSTCCDTRQR